MLVNPEIICPEIDIFGFNCYATEARLFVELEMCSAFELLHEIDVRGRFVGFKYSSEN